MKFKAEYFTISIVVFALPLINIFAMVIRLSLIIPLILILLSSCSGQGTTAIFPDGEVISVSEGIPFELSSNESLLGIFNVSFEEDPANVLLEPVLSRHSSLGEQFLGDITDFLTTKYCQDCVKIDGIALTSEGYIKLNISVRHPFDLPDGGPVSAENRLDLHLFDVAGLIFTSQGIYFPDLNIRANPGFLVNADGYSGTFDNVIDEVVFTENTHHPYRIMFENTSRGNFDPSSITGGFTDIYNPQGMNVFPQGKGFESTEFIFNVPQGRSIQFYLVLTASYGVSAKWGIAEGEPGHRLFPRYFLPGFNRHEPWKIKVEIPDYLNFLSDGDSLQTAEIRVDVWDWQDGKNVNHNWDFFYSQAGDLQVSSDIEHIKVYVPDLINSPITIERKDGVGLLPRQFTAKISNEKRMPEGRYGGIVMAADELDGKFNLLGIYKDGVTPFLYDQIRTYQFFEIDVKYSTNARPVDLVDVTPDGLNGCFKDIIADNGFAYVAMGLLGVMIFDISDPNVPRYLSEIDTDGDALRIVIDDSKERLYVADKDEGLAIINVQNPNNPFIEGKFDISGSNTACAVELYGDYSYLGDANSGLAVLDVLDPSNPTFVRAYVNRPKIRALALKDHYLYKLVANDGIEILNIEDPVNPYPVGDILINGNLKDIGISGDKAVVLLEDRLVTLDVSNPSQPSLKGTVSIPPDGRKVYLSGSNAYVANGEHGLQVISVQDLTQPWVINNFQTKGKSRGCHVDSGKIFIAADNGGLIVLGESGGELIQAGGFNTIGRAYGIGLFDTHAYIACGSIGIKSVYVEIPENATINSIVSTPFHAHDCAMHESVVYVADDTGGMALVDASDPQNLIYVGNVHFNQWQNWIADGIEIEGSLVALRGEQSNPSYPDIILMDAQNKFSPYKINEMLLPHSIYDMEFGGGYLFAAGGTGGVLSINVSDPSDLSGVGTFTNSSFASTVSSDGNYVYAMFQGLGLEILNAEDPSDLFRAGGIASTGTPMDIQIAGNYIYTNNHNGLVIYDVSDPTNPLFVSSFRLQSVFNEIVIRGRYAFVAADELGLRIIRLW